MRGHGDLDDVSVVQQPVHRGAGERLVVEERRPFFDGAIRGDDRRRLLVALADDVVEVDGLLASQPAQTEVVDDQQVDAGVASQSALVRVVGPIRAQAREHVVRGRVQHLVAGWPTCAHAGLVEQQPRVALAVVDQAGELLCSCASLQPSMTGPSLG